MAITFELPQEIERNLRRLLGDLDQVAKEAALVELYRQDWNQRARRAGPEPLPP